MEAGRSDPVKRGDRVAAATDLDTTDGFRIPVGTRGTVAEDRGSSLVVFFEDVPRATNPDERDLHAA
jgi:hypothetical protein